MKKKPGHRESFEELERMARDTSDIRPLSPDLRRRWEAALRTGTRRGRPRKNPSTQSRIVPILIDPELLAELDRCANTNGVSRSRLVAEALKARLGG